MKIYTRTGDAGKTSLVGGQRVSKAGPRLEAYGTIDEFSSFIGLLIAGGLPEDDSNALTRAQNTLFNIGAYLATDPEGNPGLAPIGLGRQAISAIETRIDQISLQLPPLHNFILPGGTPQAALAHVCRTVCRRAERRVVELAATAPVDTTVMSYLNRLSDYLFILARFLNHLSSHPELPWAQP